MNRSIKNAVALALVASGLGLGYLAIRPAHAHVREPVSLTVQETSVVTVLAPEVITVPEITIVGHVARRAPATAVACEHTENRLGGSITSYACGNWGGK